MFTTWRSRPLIGLTWQKPERKASQVLLSVRGIMKRNQACPSKWTVFTSQRFLEPFYLIWTTAIALMMLARRITVMLMMLDRSQVTVSSELLPTLSGPGLNSYQDIINLLKSCFTVCWESLVRITFYIKYNLKLRLIINSLYPHALLCFAPVFVCTSLILLTFLHIFLFFLKYLTVTNMAHCFPTILQCFYHTSP